MSKHTPGPWKYNGLSQSGGNHFNVVGTKLGRKWKVARCPFVVYDGFPPASTDMAIEDKQEAEANARLIAAAPELLKFVKEYQLSAYPDNQHRIANLLKRIENV